MRRIFDILFVVLSEFARYVHDLRVESAPKKRETVSFCGIRDFARVAGVKYRGGVMTKCIPGLFASFLSSVVVISSACIAAAQLPPRTEKQSAFEVASIKPANPDIKPYGVSFMPQGLTAHAPLNMLITTAYAIPLKQLEGDSPILKEYFDIEAKAPVNSIPPDALSRDRSAVLRGMLQRLLEERFQLTIHKESRERPAYALVVAKNAPKLKPTPPNTDCPWGSNCSRRRAGPAVGVTLPDADLSNLAVILSTFVDRPIVDRTAIQGRFDIELPPWNPGIVQLDPNNTEQLPDSTDGSIFAVLQDTLGLRLISTRAPLDILVVDEVRRPTPN